MRVWVQISEAYTCLLSGARQGGEHVVGYSRVVRSGVPRGGGGGGGRRNNALIGLPFLAIILGTAALGGTNVARYVYCLLLLRARRKVS